MMRKVSSRVSSVVVVLALAFVGWLLLPPPSPGPWPSSTPKAREAMAKELALMAAAARDKGDHRGTYEAVRVLSESFPETSFAQRVAPHVGRIRDASLHQERAEKWDYTELQSAGWGHIVQASIASESDSIRPDAPSAYLVIRASSRPAQDAVFLVLQAPAPEGCLSPSGCLVDVAQGQEGPGTAHRIVPERGQEGWWRFSDREKIASLVQARQSLRIYLPASSADPLIFEPQGLDNTRISPSVGLAQ